MKKLLLLIGIFLCSESIIAQEIQNNLSNEDKLYGLAKVWKEADKNFVFFDQVPTLDWDKTYQEFIPKILATNTTYEYYKVLQEFCSLLKDGHTRVVIPSKLTRIHEVAPPIKTELFGDNVIIVSIQNDTIKRQGLTVGMEIIEIDGVEVHEYARKNVTPYVFYSTKQDMNVQVYEYNLLKGHIDKPLKIKTKENKEFTISRDLSTANNQTPIFEFKVLDDNVGYLKISSFWGDGFQKQFDSVYTKITETSKLIIDVSENLGGSNGYAYYVLKHFIDKPFYTSRWKTLMYLPAYASWGWSTQWQDNEGEAIKPVTESLRYMKPLVVLISEKTYSAGEDFVSAFMNTNRGIIIGRATAGSTGNPIGFELPGEGGFQICSKRDYLSNGKELVGYGIEPDKEITKTKDKDHLIKEGVRILKESL